MKKIDVHNYKRQLERVVAKVSRSEISARNKAIIEEFRQDAVLEGIGVARTTRYLGVLLYCATVLGSDFDQVEERDLRRLVRTIENREDWSPWTKSTYKVMIKRFYRWLRKSGDKCPPEAAWISTRIKSSERRLPGEGELLTEEDVKTVLARLHHPRDRAIVAALYESGTRIGELAGLRVGNVDFDDNGAVLHVTGKTGPRAIRVIASVPHLAAWLQQHPLRTDSAAPLWLKLGSHDHRAPATYAAIKEMIRRAFKDAGVRKRCNPHFFRHSRATQLANHLTEFQMNQYFGWIQGSKMAATYVHLSGKNLDAAILKLNGRQVEEKQAEATALRPKKCPRCEALNGADCSYCIRCGSALDQLAAMRRDHEQRERSEKMEAANAMMHALLEDDSFRELAAKKLNELQAKKGDKLPTLGARA